MLRRLGAIGLWLAALALGAWVIAHASITADLSAFLPSAPDARHRVLLEQLKSGAPARTLVVGIEGGTPAARGQASRQLARTLRDSGRFEQVSNGENDAWKDVGDWVFERRYLLSPAISAERFTAAGLREAIDESLSLLGTPAGQALKPLLHRDPTGETQRVAEALIPAQSPRVDDGVWVGRQAERAVLLLTTRAEGADLDGQAAAIDAVHQAFAPLADQGLRLRLSGAPRFSVDSRVQIEREVKWLSLTGTVVMSALLLAAFASLRALAVAALPVATGVVAGIAAVALLYGNVHGVTLGFGSTLIGEAVDYAIYYLIQARSTGNSADGHGWRIWLRESWPTVRLGVLTSVCGFAALVFSGFAGLAQLGVFSIAGLLGAVLTARFVLPVLAPNGAQGQGLRHLLGHAARAAIGWLPRTRRLWWTAGVIAVAVLVWRQPLWSADLASLSPVPAEDLALDAALRADLGAGDASALVVVQGPDAQTVLQRAEAAGALLDTWVDQGALAGYDSVARLLPSLRTQHQRQAALPDADTLRAALAQATQGGPLRAERLGPFIDAVQQARQRAPDTPATALAGPLAPLVRALLMQRDDGTWSALLSLQPGPRELDTAAIERALQSVPDTRVLAIGAELRHLYQRYLGEAQTQALLGALAVVAVIAVALRRPAAVLAVCQPLALAVLLTMAGLAALGVKLGILHLVGLLLVVAVGSNYALFFNQTDDRVQLDDDTLASLLLANLTTVLSFSLIALSAIPALSAIGIVVAPGAALGLVLSAVFVKRGAVTSPELTPHGPR